MDKKEKQNKTSNFLWHSRRLSILTGKILNLNSGLAMVEILVSFAILSIVLLSIISFVLWASYYNTKTKAYDQVLENARRVLDTIAYEIRGAKSIYNPTTTSDQLSLETEKYAPSGEDSTFIDFFICGSALCLKKESQDPIILTSDSIKIESIYFSEILNGTGPSVKIDITINYQNQYSDDESYASISSTSTASLRSY